MELIMLKDMEKVGRKGEVVRVRDGFARNFLLPQKAAMPLTAASERFVKEQKTRAEKRRAAEKAAAEEAAKKLANVKLSIQAACGEQDKLFGSVTSEDISKLLADQGFEFDKKKILLKEPIRTLGTFQVVVEVYPQVRTNVRLDVLRKA